MTDVIYVSHQLACISSPADADGDCLDLMGAGYHHSPGDAPEVCVFVAEGTPKATALRMIEKIAREIRGPLATMGRKARGLGTLKGPLSGHSKGKARAF